nr:hypothetical protein [uncultured Holophaga sp.]
MTGPDRTLQDHLDHLGSLLEGPWGAALALSPLALCLVWVTGLSRQGLEAVQPALPFLLVAGFASALAMGFWLFWDPDARRSPRYGKTLKRAQAGEPEAQYQLGLIYRDGLEGFHRDALSARHWIALAAAQNHAGALEVQASDCEPAPVPRPIPPQEAEDEPPDRLPRLKEMGRRSLPLLLLVALGGTLIFALIFAALLLTFAFMTSALGTFLMAMVLGAILVIASLALWAWRSPGMRYRHGARRLITRAEQGDSAAQRLLAQAYLTGEQGIPRDSLQATCWLERAAQTGDAEAAYLLAQWLDRGIGRARNRPLARHWLAWAAGTGHGPARVLLRRWDRADSSDPD